MGPWTALQPSVKGSTESTRMALLTLSLAGLQFTWGIEMTYCTPYLLALGLTKSRTSLVWIAGPLSGLIMAPIVGVMSDQSTSRFGRRRPFMIIGSLVVTVFLVTLGWAKEIVGYFIEDADLRKTCTIVLAVGSIYAVDFAINAVQSCCRSLIADTLPETKQQTGSAWGSRMQAMGHLIGYYIGTIDLVQLFGPSLGDTQFKKLIIIAAASLLIAVGVTSWAVTERIFLPEKDSDILTVPQVFRQIIDTTKTLPPRIQALCWAQFWSWIGWFPFLFYSTTWVGETYFRYDAPHDVKQSKDALGEIGRIGSVSLVIYSFVSFVGSFILPLLVRAPDEKEFTHRPPASIAGIVNIINKHRPDILGAWFIGHLMFSSAMILAPFATSFRFATALVAFCGIPSMLASWAPTTFLGVEVNRLSRSYGHGRRSSLSPMKSSPSIPLHQLESGAASPNPPSSPSGQRSGIYFGILNIYTTIPQFMGTFISMIVFSILEPGKSPELAHDADPSEHHGTDGPNAIAVCLFIGAISTLGAAYATKKLKDLQ